MRRLTVADDINRLVLESTNMAEQAQKSQLQVTQERVDPNSEAVPRQASSIVNSLSIKTMGVIGASNSKSIWNAFVEVEEGDDDEGQTDESVVYSHPSERQIRRKGRFRGEVEMESTITSRAQKRAMSTIPDEIPHLNKKSAHQAVGASRYSITNFSQQRGAINSVGPKPAELSISLLQEERISKPAMPVCRKEARQPIPPDIALSETLACGLVSGCARGAIDLDDRPTPIRYSPRALQSLSLVSSPANTLFHCLTSPQSAQTP
ncbi:hypothetical protein BC830DRAFT_1171753 [Chytriomyces sp. MP71]|nr:hypothetical protein BC830DRAFT_1171753 [Chytriomyces sp. MP71]